MQSRSVAGLSSIQMFSVNKQSQKDQRQQQQFLNFFSCQGYVSVAVHSTNTTF